MFLVSIGKVKVARFPHATRSPSAHSCLVPHPFAVLVMENVVEKSRVPFVKPLVGRVLDNNCL